MVKKYIRKTPVNEREMTEQGAASASSPPYSNPNDQPPPLNPNLNVGAYEIHGGAMEEQRRMMNDSNEHRRVEYLETPIKSENDKKEYRVIKLQNGLIAVLISDMKSGAQQDEDKEKATSAHMSKDDQSDTDMEDESEDEDDEFEDEDDEGSFDEDEESDEDESEDDVLPRGNKTGDRMVACAMSVGVGTFSDPPEIQGLAHFLEHMIFMGSQKYPKENDFDAYVSKYGGHSNGVTGLELTTFNFCIQKDNLKPALDRFAQFFINPLMKRDSITREREAVESEFQMALPSDTNKKLQLQSSFACDNHPVRKFSWGNMTTLRDNVSEDKLYEELHKFRERHYSAHRMKLAIQGKLPLDTLEEYVVEYFSDIPNNGLPADDFSEFKGVKSFDTPAFRRMYKIKPIKDLCSVEITWVMPSIVEHYKTKPDEYLTTVLGNCGQGSLMSYLRQKLWCIAIICDHEEEFEDNCLYSLFYMNIVLTDEGHEHLEEVLDAVFSYINLVKREGPQKILYDENQHIVNTNFRFLEETEAEEYVVDMVETMFYYPPREYIIGNFLLYEYNADLIKQYLDYLAPDNMNIIVYNKMYNEQEFDKLEPWFVTKYTDTEISPECIKRWSTIEPYSYFSLPLPNMFLVNDFSMVSLPEKVPDYPEKVYSDKLLNIWYRPDPTFGLPICYMSLYFISDVPYKSVKNSVLMDLYVMILNQMLIEDLYPAVAVGYNYDIETLEHGALLRMDGFTEKLPLVLMMIVKRMVDFPNLITKDLFEIMKMYLATQYYNSLLDPKNITTTIRLTVLMQVYRTDIQKHTAIRDVTFGDLLEFVKSYLSHLYIQCLVQGNMTQNDVVEKIREPVGMFQCESLELSKKPQPRIMQLPVGTRYCKVRNFNETDVNSVVSNYYQLGVESDEGSAMINLLLVGITMPKGS
ncbi:Nardilysin [Harpegnathos saltator]|uniref:Nardilysin n=1 Tax=Harpegnathos saltator TaxID=610380 RepID=E2C9D8_HARSA|nr:Nardilysin [Harpegnathos saltator]